MKRIHIFIIFLILLLSSFWRLVVAESLIGRFVPYIGIAAFTYYYYKTGKQKNFYSKYILYYLIGVFASCVYCRIFHQQGVFPTLVASYSCLGLGGFYLFSKYKLSYKDSIIILRNISVLFCICYIVQWLLYPLAIFATANDEFNVTDDAFRMRLPGSICGYILLFMGLNNYLLTKRKKELAFAILGAVPILIQGFRSLIFLTLFAVIYMIFIIQKRSSKMIFYLAGFFIVLALSTNIPIVQKKIDEMAYRQERGDTFSNKDYVRNIALVYYWDVVHNKPLEHVFGGGYPRGVKYSRTEQYQAKTAYADAHMVANSMGLWWIDLGLVGLSFVIGIPTVLLLVLLVLYCFFKSRSLDICFIRCVLIVVFLGSIITSMEIYRSGNLIILSLLFYCSYARSLIKTSKKNGRIFSNSILRHDGADLNVCN